ncbi:NAD(P)-dependent oxidoreductase [Mycobacterium sp. MYCO198283]|uniref:NAD(P)-dependent oxidoreductase n=1 Tax=Mycobacterium sp. MYCO198283 TaxID=2883505 RepID=UPI001E55C1C9|nr:NAD(P)-dependent oxidoreductase [Mycobacterium sp. MYCO198283]MCG5434244.1 NAD(P)-dependent oxidoreductase [Mycobacterium sp. MYCO198283]
MTRVGFVGAGRMGRPMVARLVAAGHDVRVLGRRPEQRAALAELGATPVADTADAARDAEVVVVCVFTDDQVREVCLDGGLPAAMPAGATLVIHTTGSPRTVDAVAAQAAPCGVTVVDAPVSGGPHDIAAGRLTLFVGGDDDTVARLRPVLSAYADPLLAAGARGDGQRIKLVNNALFAAQLGLVAEAVRLGGRLGVNEAALLAALPHGSGASRALGSIAAAGSVAAFTAAVAGFVGKDVAVLRKTVADLGGDLGILDAVIDAAASESTGDGH